MKVKLQEVIYALKNAGFWWTKELALKIEQHGIEVSYMQISDAELLAIRRAHENKHGQYVDDSDYLMVARDIIARLGVAPSLDHLSTVSDVTERLVNTPEREKAMNAERLRKAKQICEQAGLAVVPKDPTPEMLEAGNVALIRIKQDPTPSVFNRAFYTYKAMLEAAKEVKP
jgi:hypothetical protein